MFYFDPSVASLQGLEYHTFLGLANDPVFGTPGAADINKVFFDNEVRIPVDIFFVDPAAVILIVLYLVPLAPGLLDHQGIALPELPSYLILFPGSGAHIKQIHCHTDHLEGLSMRAEKEQYGKKKYYGGGSFKFHGYRHFVLFVFCLTWS